MLIQNSIYAVWHWYKIEDKSKQYLLCHQKRGRVIVLLMIKCNRNYWSQLHATLKATKRIERGTFSKGQYQSQSKIKTNLWQSFSVLLYFIQICHSALPLKSLGIHVWRGFFWSRLPLWCYKWWPLGNDTSQFNVEIPIMSTSRFHFPPISGNSWRYGNIANISTVFGNNLSTFVLFPLEKIMKGKFCKCWPNGRSILASNRWGGQKKIILLPSGPHHLSHF